MPQRTVVLRHIRGVRDIRELHATLTAEGDLIIDGQDLGDGVEEIFGYREYEWRWTIRARDLPILVAALGGDADLLLALGRRFSDERAADLLGFLESHEIPYEVWSRLGD